MEILGQLGISWNLVLAQGVNFLILLWVLNRFLYRPIVKMLDERKAKAEALQLEVSKMEEKRKQFERWTSEQVAEARHKSETILVEAEKFAAKVKTRKMDELAMEKQRSHLDAQKQLDRDRHTLEQELRQSITRDTADNITVFFKNIANESLHRRLIDKTLEEFEQHAFDRSNVGKVVQADIETAEALTKQDRERIQKALEKKMGHSVKIVSSVNAKLVAGLRIILGGFDFDGSLVGRLSQK